MKARQKTDAEMRALDRDIGFAPEPPTKRFDWFDVVLLLAMVIGYFLFIIGTVTILIKIFPPK